jgi:hypothetical protein
MITDILWKLENFIAKELIPFYIEQFKEFWNLMD